MIRPPARAGVAFSEKSDGDVRNDLSARSRVSDTLGLAREWATVRQVHGDRVVRVDASGDRGEADALWTSASGLPLSVFTADCFGVVLQAPNAVGVAHAGWRGAAAGVVVRLRSEMSEAGFEPEWAGLGPGIGPCCFEVGPEVSARFEGYVGQTTWETSSVDLPSALGSQLDGLEVWSAGSCTHHDAGWFSHRADATLSRLAAIGWVP